MNNKYFDRIEKLKETFLNDIKYHSMEILNKNGIYRTIKFSRNGSNVYHFYLTTWDGHLNISGDMGSYTFARTNDMFKFFVDERDDLIINPSYWGEKLQCGRGYNYELIEELDPEELEE